MSTKRTFEDRLLDELKSEVRLREAERGKTERGESEAKASVRRLSTPRRIAVVVAACAAAWVAAAVVPGSPADTKAFAVERHGDGSVTLTVRDHNLGVEAQRELAKTLRPNGIQVEVDVLAPGYTCKPWGRKAALDLTSVSSWGTPASLGSWSITLRRGDLLAFENTRGSSQPRAIKAYEVKAYEVRASNDEDEASPCVPVKRGPSDD